MLTKVIAGLTFLALSAHTVFADVSTWAIEFQPTTPVTELNRNVEFTMADGSRTANGAWANINGRIVFVTVYHAAEGCKNSPISIYGIRSIDCIVPSQISSNTTDLVFVIFPKEVTPSQAPAISRSSLKIGETAFIHHQDGVSAETVEAYLPGVLNGPALFVATSNTQARLAPGDSGSPLFNAKGELVGVLRGVTLVPMPNGSTPELTGFSSLHLGSPLADKLIRDLASLDSAIRQPSHDCANHPIPEENPSSEPRGYDTYECTQTCRLSLYNQYDLEMSDYWERNGMLHDPSLRRLVYPENEASAFEKSLAEALAEVTPKLQRGCDRHDGRTRGGYKVKGARLQGSVECRIR